MIARKYNLNLSLGDDTENEWVGKPVNCSKSVRMIDERPLKACPHHTMVVYISLPSFWLELKQMKEQKEKLKDNNDQKKNTFHAWIGRVLDSTE